MTKEPTKQEMLAELQRSRGMYEKTKRDVKTLGYATTRLWHALHNDDSRPTLKGASR
jgi:hypothetical protein